MQYIPCNSALLAQETLFEKSTFLPKVFQKVRKSRPILISRQNSVYAKALNFRRSPNFSAKALRAFTQLLPPCFETSVLIDII